MDGDRTFGRPACVFVGRLLELATLRAALAAARAGEPQVVLIQGEAGIGKSSLVSEFLDGQRGVPVVAASGEEAEAFLPYGVVQQLAAGVAAVSAGALAGLELLCQGPRADADPLRVGVELLALLSSVQEREAVAVVIEDLQWIDLASARALLFAFRRLGADRVLVVLTAGRRDVPAGPGVGALRERRSPLCPAYAQPGLRWTRLGCCAGPLGALGSPTGRSGDSAVHRRQPAARPGASG